MADVIDLQVTIEKLNAAALARFRPEPADDMKKLAEHLARQRAQRQSRAPSPTLVERQEAAVRRFLRGDGAPDFRTLRYACLGSTHYIAKDRLVLLADQRALAALLATVAQYTGEPRRFRRLYDWLLRAYLNVERHEPWFASPAASRGNERLRAFLEASFDSVRKSEPAPEWVGTLASFPEILSSDPGRRFAQGVLAGDPRDLDDACRSLRVTGTSWLALDAVGSATAEAVSSDHATFVAHIPTLLIVVAEPRFATLRDEVYAALVTRYAAMPDRPVHATLRDALVAAWKNPWLKQNASPWGRVTEDVRKMVGGWLKLDIIQQFFEVLSDDKRQDRSRFEFWSRYHERMDDVYIALGSAAYYSNSADLMKLRQALEGRLLKLNNAGPDTNAFIMFMGDAVIVEFSQRANAAFCYALRHAPVGPYDRAVTIAQLKRGDVATRMIHGRAGGLSWQENFARGLHLASRSQQVAVHWPPPSAAIDQVAAPRQTWQHRTSSPRADSGPGKLPSRSPTPTSPSLGDVAALARKHNVEWENLRPKGGRVWVYTWDDNPEIGRQLIAWGFAYRQGKGWWRA
jgi:hypothetical protein